MQIDRQDIRPGSDHRHRWPHRDRARRWRTNRSRRPPSGGRGDSRDRPCANANHEDSRLLSAELRPERPAGFPAEQHGRPRRHRRRHHRHRPGRIAGHGAQRRPQRHRQERVRHRDDLAGRVHGRVLLARQGTAARARRDRHRALGHQGQGAERAALSAVRRQGARAHRALCDVGSAARAGAAGRSADDGAKERAAATMAAGYRVYRVDGGILPSTGRAGAPPAGAGRAADRGAAAAGRPGGDVQFASPASV